MAQGADERHQLLIRIVAKAVWWLVQLQIDPKERPGFHYLRVARTLPGFEYQDGEPVQPEDQPEQ